MTGTGGWTRRAGHWAALGAAALLAATALVVTSPGTSRAPRAAAALPGNDGSYAIVDAGGGVMTFGGAQYSGDALEQPLQQPVVAATPDRNGGYWLVASDGGIFSYGDAQFFGSTGSIHLNKPIVGMAATPSGDGYWLVASDGGIFTYGDAQFFGSTGSLHLNQPIVGMTSTPDGGGYWLVASDAGVFTYGDAAFSGSAQSPLHPPLFPQPLSAPIPAVVGIMNDVTGPQAAHQDGLRVAFSGDSLSLYEGQYVEATSPPYAVYNGAAAGCGYTDGAPTHPWSDPASTYLSPGACALWADQLQWVVSRFHPDVTVIQTGYWETQARLFNGAYQSLADPAYSAYIEQSLNQAVQIAHSDGGAVILSTSPYFNDGTPFNLVDAYNQIVDGVAAQHPDYVSIDDLYTVLDPGNTYAPVVDGIQARGADGVHITEAAVDNLIEPALNQQIANVAGNVYNSNA